MIIIKNGKIYTMAGKIFENGSIIIENGIIKEIKENSETLPQGQIIDAKGKIIMPGFVEAHGHIGSCLTATSLNEDINEMTDPITPEMRAIDSINPMDPTFKDAIQGGITTGATGPGSGNVVGGTFTVIKLHGNRIDDMVIKNPLAMKCAFGENPKRVYGNMNKMPSTRMGTAAQLRDLLFKSIEYRNKKNTAKEDPDKAPSFDIKLESMLPVVNGEIPLKAHAHQADDIFTAIRIAKEFGVKLTLDHCSEGHLIAEELAKEGFPAIIGPTFGWKSKFELRNLDFKAPKILFDAGVKIAIMTDNPVLPAESLPMCAALAYKSGLDEMEALKCITINAAQILGINKKVGSLEVGKDADIVIWDRHPFDLQSNVIKTIVNGKVVYSK
ncbi:MAG: amidohydrolase [Clostridiales bacterium]